MAKAKELKVVSDTATLKYNKETEKWIVEVSLKKGKHTLIRSKKPELAIGYFNGAKYKERLVKWGVDFLEVFNEDGKVTRTVTRGVKKPRIVSPKKPGTVRKTPVKTAFIPFTVQLEGEGALAGKTIQGTVLSKSAGSYKVETIGSLTKVLRKFDSSTGEEKTNNPYHVWKLDVKEVGKKHLALKKKAKAA